MMFLRHSSNANNEGRKRLLLLTYFEEPMTAITIQAKSLSNQPEMIESSSSLSPLKRQMSQIRTTTKRQLTYISENANLKEKDAKEPSS
ncbi:hypothetical protein Leryth_021205 [Lithospermum erythrorhizon]|nr:hypothetical protein Leryth_021205 [Lithospermum erythrorhizon]